MGFITLDRGSSRLTGSYAVFATDLHVQGLGLGVHVRRQEFSASEFKAEAF